MCTNSTQIHSKSSSGQWAGRGGSYFTGTGLLSFPDCYIWPLWGLHLSWAKGILYWILNVVFEHEPGLVILGSIELHLLHMTLISVPGMRVSGVSCLSGNQIFHVSDFDSTYPSSSCPQFELSPELSREALNSVGPQAQWLLIVPPSPPPPPPNPAHMHPPGAIRGLYCF